MENSQISSTQTQSVVGAFMTKVYSWMTLALFITGGIAMYLFNSKEFLNYSKTNGLIFMLFFFAQIGSVWYLSRKINSYNYLTAIIIFIAYSVLSGFTFAIMVYQYTPTSIASTFFITAGTFTIMSLAGFFTKKDLSGFGAIMMMGLIGLIIATVVNYFLQSSTLNYIISYVGVMIFVGLTAYDTQKLKIMATQLDGEQAKKGSIMGALTLYLDFINLFLYLLRVLGDRK